MPGHSKVDFVRINREALGRIESIVARWLPDGQQRGREWVALNPRRTDHRVGSFSVNLATGRWADFATGDKGGDLISLAAYLGQLSQVEAARNVAAMLGISADGR